MVKEERNSHKSGNAERQESRVHAERAKPAMLDTLPKHRDRRQAEKQHCKFIHASKRGTSIILVILEGDSKPL